MRLSTLAPLFLVPALLATPALAETKIGVVSMPRLQREAPQIKSAGEAMRAEFEKKQQSLESDARKLEEDAKKFQREGAAMSSEQRARTEKDLTTRKIDLDAKQRDLAEQAQGRQREMLRDLQASFDAAIKAVVQEQGLNLVVPDPVYADDSLDITDAVLRKLAEGAKAAPEAKGKKKK